MKGRGHRHCLVGALAAGLIAWSAAAAAAPRPAAAPPAKVRPAPTAVTDVRAEIARLDQEYEALVARHATLAAIQLARQLVALETQADGVDSVAVQLRKTKLEGLLMDIEDYPAALALDRELLATAERRYGPESQQVLLSLNTMLWLSQLATTFGDDGAIEAQWQRTLALTRKLCGERSLPYADLLGRYARYQTWHDRHTVAQELYEQLLPIQEALSKDDRPLLGPIEELAMSYWHTRQRARAIALFDRLLALTAKPGTTIAVRGATLGRIIALYRAGGRGDLAEPLARALVALYETEIATLERDRPGSFQIPAMLGQVGQLHRQGGDLTRAEQALERAVALDEKRGGASEWALELGEVEDALGKPREALAVFDRAGTGLTAGSPELALRYDADLAVVLGELGDSPRAERVLEDYRARIEKAVGSSNPLGAAYGVGEIFLASRYMVLGKPAMAERLLSDGLERAERELQRMLNTGTEADHAAYFALHGCELDVAINFEVRAAPRSASMARLGLTTVLRRKGRVLDAAAAGLSAIRARLSPGDQQLLDELGSARTELARLLAAGRTVIGDTDLGKEIAGREDRIRKLEIQVGQKSAAYRAARAPITLAAVQKAIPPAARLVEIVNYQSDDPAAIFGRRAGPEPRGYAAFVVGRTGDPVLVDLGPARPIDDAVEQFRAAVSDPDNDRARELGHALFARTLGKIAPALGGATRVLIAPDGALNVVPFSALVDDRGAFLLERYTFTYLTSGRDLLRLGVQTRPRGGGAIFADPRFDDAAPATPAGAAGVAPGARGRRSVDLTAQRWAPLPGTGQEADEVARHMPGLAVYRGADATETALKALHGPKILHLATHGFFLTDEPVTGRSPGAPPEPGVRPSTADEARENPLLRSGLVLAGANQLRSGDDDGILTAMEASGLDLQGTQLVVLSACETGVGKVTNGDGVYGLRRALVIAGAESLMMSLWQVDDTATRDLMAGYYTRLGAGNPRSAALREIQRELARRPAYAHPYYWASFVAAGADTPIR